MNKISPHAFVSPNVIMGKGNIIEANAIVLDGVILGDNNYIGYGCVIGDLPEKIGYFEKEKNKGVRIGNNNRFTKLVTVDGGTQIKTEILNDCTFLAAAHVGHDCVISSNCILTCGVKLGGGTLVLRYCNFGLNSVTHPRTTVGMGTMLGANSFLKGCSRAWTIYAGVPAKEIGENLRGKQRWLG